MLHRSASVVVCLMALIHAAFTAYAFGRWSPGAVWFLGTGLGLLLLGVMNIAHVGCEPCRMPTAPPVRWANWIAVLFGFGAVAAVPEPQALVIACALSLQAVAGQWTLLGNDGEGGSEICE
jgi:hypothetical protein